MKKFCFFLLVFHLGQLSICQPVNDNCNSAQNITVSASLTTVNVLIADSTINNEEGCNGSFDDYGDVWYEFTMPVDGNVFILGYNTANFFALYDSCSDEQIQCGNANVFFTNLTSGTNYKLRVFRSSEFIDSSTTFNFDIIYKEQPINDDCASAQTIEVSTNESTLNHNIFGASYNSEEDCSGNQQNLLDIWYDFTMPINGKLVIYGNWIDSIALYSECSDTDFQCAYYSQFSNLTAGANYKLRLTRDLSNLNGVTSFNANFSYYIIDSPPTLNDSCVNSQNINITTSYTTLEYEIDGAAIESNSTYNCSGNLGNSADIWFDFTMPVNGNLVGGSAFGNENYFELYDECGGVKLNCGYNDFVFYGLSASTNYKLRLFRPAIYLFEDFWDQTFQIKITEISSNDACSDSENIVVSSIPLEIVTDFNASTLNNNNNSGCSESSSISFVDAWYDFIMPLDGFIRINRNISDSDYFFALYDSCSGAEIGCFSGQGDFSGLTMGSSYKLRFFDNQQSSFYYNDSNIANFTIEATEILGISNEPIEKAIAIYHDPVIDVIKINISDNQNIVAIDCFDLLGQKVFQTTNHTQIDVSNLKSSIYLIKITTDIGSVTKKIIIQ